MPPAPEIPDSRIFNPLDVPPVPIRPRLGRRCLGPACETLVIYGRFCDGCVTSAATDLAQRFERELITQRCLEPGSNELRAALTGTASMRSASWYERGTQLGDITFIEATELRARTETACFLVALGGVAALKHLPGRSTIREVVTAWSEEPPASSAIVRKQRPSMADFYNALPGRVQTSAFSKPETRFDAYAFAVFALVIWLLFIH